MRTGALSLEYGGRFTFDEGQAEDISKVVNFRQGVFLTCIIWIWGFSLGSGFEAFLDTFRRKSSWDLASMALH